ncbi:MAG: hypothetical protein MSC31_04955 [Solirubrobacteraceae bacterium MAG38_C4-C5]|nr:hypothetical protein [Candidatus Siliceabacter maunaloa]
MVITHRSVRSTRRQPRVAERQRPADPSILGERVAGQVEEHVGTQALGLDGLAHHRGPRAQCGRGHDVDARSIVMRGAVLACESPLGSRHLGDDLGDLGSVPANLAATGGQEHRHVTVVARGVVHQTAYPPKAPRRLAARQLALRVDQRPDAITDRAAAVESKRVRPLTAQRLHRVAPKVDDAHPGMVPRTPGPGNYRSADALQAARSATKNAGRASTRDSSPHPAAAAS